MGRRSDGRPGSLLELQGLCHDGVRARGNSTLMISLQGLAIVATREGLVGRRESDGENGGLA